MRTPEDRTGQWGQYLDLRWSEKRLEKIAKLGATWSVFLTKYYYNRQDDNEMDRTHSCTGEQRMHIPFGRKTRRKEATT
jgi:hypothetical protein